MTDPIRQLFTAAGIELQPADWTFFEELHEAVLEGNQTMNLTRITERDEFFRKHVLDSLLPFVVCEPLRELGSRIRLLDLGSGVGFPGLALARVRPSRKVVLLERTQKKAAFLQAVKEAFDLTNVIVVDADAREAHRHVDWLDQGCDVVVARAVGRLGAVAELAAPLLKPGGLLVHYKGGQLDDAEVKEGALRAHRVRLEQGPPLHYVLPPDDGRAVVCCLNRAKRRKRDAKSGRNAAKRRSRGDKAP